MNLAILQARMSSTRLPGKVLKQVNGIPLLKYQCDRLARSKKINHLIIATSIDELDDEINEFAKKNQIECYRGSIDDVLERYYFCAKEFKLDSSINKLNIIRVTGDCPIIDSKLVDTVISYFEKNECNYASNTLIPTFPDGMDVEIFDYQALEIAYNEATLNSEREHVTPYIKNSDRFTKLNFKSQHDFSHLRLTVDITSDFELIKVLIEGLYERNPNFSYLDVISYMTKHPNLFYINSDIQRDEGFSKSLKEDGN
jgi:spore coat polysaccharide biosynthesis protein SpsF